MSSNEPVISIGGIEITDQLVHALQNLQGDSQDEKFLSKQCLILASIDLDKYGFDRKFFEVMVQIQDLLSALNKEGGAK